MRSFFTILRSEVVRLAIVLSINREFINAVLLNGFLVGRYNEHEYHLVNQMTRLEMEVAKNGKVEVPPEIATALGWQVGEKLTVQVQNGEVRIFSQAQAVRRVQDWVKSFVAEGRSLSDELIAERRQEETLGE